MTLSTTARPARVLRRSAGVLALSLVAAGVTTAGSALLGVAPSPAQADPGDTYVPTGSSQLVQSEDLASILVPLDTEKVRLRRDPVFSSCLGEGTRWTEVLPGSPRPVSSVWTRGHHEEMLTEFIAQAPNQAVARQWEATLVSEGIKACRKRVVYDFHFGQIHTDPVGAGTATWAVSYTGQSKRGDGGVVVVRQGVNVGFLEVNGRWGVPSWQTMESVAKVAADRLG